MEQIKAKKHTKPGITLNGAFARVKDYASKYSDVQLEVVVLAGTNDLNRRNVTTQSLIDQLVDHIAVLKEFCNIKIKNVIQGLRVQVSPSASSL